MGTKVQCESHLLGYSSVRNLNEDSSSSWSPYYEDKTLTEHLYNCFMWRPVPEYSGYDKEMVKRTMLEHEAIFRKQVCELHRLYKIQKDLMDDLKRKERCKIPLQSGISQSYLFSSAMASEITNKKWQMRHLTEASTGFNMTADAEIEDIKPSLDLLKENYMQFSQIPRQNGFCLEDGELSDSKPKGRPRKMLDLQLPADVYIDVEDSDRIEKEHIFKPFCRVKDNSSIICDVEHDNDVKLTLGTRENCSIGNWNSDAIQQNGQYIQSLDHLNEARTGLGCGEQSGSVSNHLVYARTNTEEVHGHHSPTRSSTSFLPRDFFTNKHRDEGTCSNFFNAEKGKAGPEWPSFNYEDGGSGNRVNTFNLGLSRENCPMLSEPSDLKVKREHNVPSYDHGETQTWFEEKPTLGTGFYQKGSPFIDSNNSVLTNSQVPGASSVIPFSENMICSPPVVSSQRKPRRVITHIPIAVQALPCFPASEMMNFRKRKPKGSLRDSTIVCNKLQSDADLNSHPEGGIEICATENGCHQDLWSDSNSSTQFKHTSDSSVYENSEGCASEKFPKLKNDVSFCLPLPNGTRQDGKLEESSEGMSWLRTKPSCTDSQVEFNFSKSLNQSPVNFPPSSQVKKSWKQKNRSSHRVTKRILGFPITDELQQGIKTEVSEVGTVAEKGITRKNNIDLNALDISPEDEIPSITTKIMHEIDLEVPIPSYETLDILAAESLMLISSSLTQQLAPASCVSLHWFANVVSSKADKTDHDGDNEGDYFESLTLKLKEMKPDEYLPLPQEDRKDENDTGTASLLLTKTRRGQARKRRQRKDFQKDILPGLVSLSRHEMTEDLQAFDCIMRAMGKAWESNLPRKDSSGRGRGRSRARNLAVSVTENCLSSPPTQEAEANSKIDERSIIRWGRTTRRGRRPRVKPGNASLVVS